MFIPHKAPGGSVGRASESSSGCRWVEIHARALDAGVGHHVIEFITKMPVNTNLQQVEINEESLGKNRFTSFY